MGRIRTMLNFHLSLETLIYFQWTGILRVWNFQAIASRLWKFEFFLVRIGSSIDLLLMPLVLWNSRRTGSQVLFHVVIRNPYSTMCWYRDRLVSVEDSRHRGFQVSRRTHFSDIAKDEDPVHYFSVLFSYQIHHGRLQGTLSRMWLG